MKGKQSNVENRWEPIPVDHPLAHQEGVAVQLEWDAESEVWVTYVPELNGISTFGETREQVLESTRDMTLAFLQSMDDLQMRLPLSRDQVRKIRTALG